MFVPRDDIAVLRALLDETVVVGAMARALASAEARHVAEDLGVVCREPVHRGDNLGRARGSISLKRNRRQGRVLAGPEAGGCRGTGDDSRVCLRRLRRGWRRGLVSSAAQNSAPTPTTATRMAPPIHGLNPLDALAVFASGRRRGSIPVFLLPITAHCIVFAGRAGWDYSRAFRDSRVPGVGRGVRHLGHDVSRDSRRS